MTSDEKSKSFAGVDADRDEREKKKNIGRSRFRGKNGENVPSGFYRTFTTYFALFVSWFFRFSFFPLKSIFVVER